MAEPDKIEWAKDQFLSWSDFKAEQNPAQYHPAKTAVQYSATWKADWKADNGQLSYRIYNIQLVSEFQKQRSWVRKQEIQDETQSNTILKHEQGHFDLAEKCKNQITQNIEKLFTEKLFPVFGKSDENAKDFVLKDSKERIEIELEKQTNEIFRKQEEEYDKITDFGFNKEKQQEFDSEFAKLRIK